MLAQFVSARLSTSLLTVLCLSLFVAGCDRDTPDKFIASGKSYMDKQDYGAAAIQLKNAVQKAPDSAEARYLLGLALARDDDPVSAEIELQKAAAAGYSPDEVYPVLVHTLLQQGQYKKALQEATTRSDITTAKAEMLALSGEAQLGLGKPELARSAFDAAIAADANNQTAKLGLAKVATVGGDLNRATQLVDEVLAQAPRSVEALLTKAVLQTAAGKNAEAVTAYEQAIQVQSHLFRAYMSLVPLLIQTQQADSARVKVDALKKFAAQSPGTVYLDALVTYTKGDLPKARELIRAAMKMTTDYIPALLLAGTIEHQSGNYVQADAHLSKVVLALPNAPYPRRLLVSTLLRTGQLARAKESLDVLLTLAPNEGQTLILAGEVALANQEVDKAEQYFQKALSVDPKNVITRTRLGQAHLAAGDVQRAAQELEAASDADRSEFQADVVLVTLHLGKKEVDKAFAAAKGLEKKQPNNPLTYNLLGTVQLAKKDEAGARSSFEHALQIDPTYFLSARNLAMLDLREGKPDAAKQRFETILTKDPKHEEALAAIIELLQRGQASDAEVDKAIDRAVAANPESVRARIIRITTLLDRKDFKAALTAAQQAQAALPEAKQILEVLGRAQIAAGETNQGIATFGKLALLAPHATTPLLAQAQAYASSNDWSSARRALQKALDIQPGLPAAQLGLIKLGIQSKDYARARSDAQVMQKRWPKDATGYLAEIEVLAAQENWKEAEQFLRNAIQQTGNPQLVTRLYVLLLEHGSKGQGEQLVEAWLKDHPKDIVVPTFAAETQMQKRDFATAARWYKAALKAQPDNVATLNNLAWVLGQAHDTSGIEYGRKAMSLAPEAPAVLDTLGWLYVEHGDVAQGLDLLQKAHRLAPTIPNIQLNLAKALIKAGQGASARPHLEALARLPAGVPLRQEAEKLLATL